jgi:hypothetical protein
LVIRTRTKRKIGVGGLLGKRALSPFVTLWPVARNPSRPVKRVALTLEKSSPCSFEPPTPTRDCIHAASATLHPQGTMASPEIADTAQQPTDVAGDANGLVNHTDENADTDETEAPKEENIPVNETEEQITDDVTIDKHVFLSPTRRIRTHARLWPNANACLRTRNEK